MDAWSRRLSASTGASSEAGALSNDETLLQRELRRWVSSPVSGVSAQGHGDVYPSRRPPEKSASWRARPGEGGVTPTSSDVTEQDEVVALQRLVSTMRAVIHERDRELVVLRADALRQLQNSDVVSEGLHGESPESLQRAEEEMFLLETQKREADEEVEALEARLALSEAFRGSGPDFSAEEALDEVEWEERVRAMEREMEQEAAVALAIEERVHWLRVQIQRQCPETDERVEVIRALISQLEHGFAPGTQRTEKKVYSVVVSASGAHFGFHHVPSSSIALDGKIDG